MDACNLLVGSDPIRVSCIGGRRLDAGLVENFVDCLEYMGGSTAAVAYACDGSVHVSKETIEILGHNKAARIEDFRLLWLDGQAIRLSKQADKGHVTQFRRGVSDAESVNATESTLRTTRSVLLAMRLLAGRDMERDEVSG